MVIIRENQYCLGRHSALARVYPRSGVANGQVIFAGERARAFGVDEAEEYVFLRAGK